MRINVVGGTPSSQTDNLCTTCRMGMRISGQNREEFTYCRWMEKPVPFFVATCSQHDDRRNASVHDLEKIAWKLCADKKGKQIGFLSPSDYVAKRQDGTVRKFDPDDYEPFAGE